MLRKLVWSLLGFALFGISIATPAKAAPISCDDVFRLSQFLTGDAVDGCIAQDKLYSNFSYLVNGQVPGSTNTFRASRVAVTITFGVNAVGQDLHTIEFSPLSNWNVPFVLSYTVSIYPPLGAGTIVGADNQGTYPISGSSAGNLTTTVNPGAWVVHSTPIATDPGPQFFDPVKSVAITHSYVPGSPASNLEGFKETVTEQFPIPEPATYTLLGSSLIALAFIGKRIRVR